MKKLGLAIGLLALLASCNDDDNTNPGNAGVYTNLMPLSVGKQWKYTTTTYAVEPAGLDTLIHHYQNFYDWKVTKDTLINGELCYVMAKKDTKDTSGQVWNRNDYYKTTPTGFYGVATDESGGGGSNLAWLKQLQPETEKYLFPESAKYKTFQNGLFFPSQPLHLLKYPVTINDQWASLEFGPDAGIIRKYVGTETITVPAGTFHCTHLQIYLYSDSQPTRIIDQYFAAGKGLIKSNYDWITSQSTGTGSISVTTELTYINF